MPVQYFQSVIAIEVAVAGALLFEIRFFDRDDTARARRRPDERILVLFAVVIFVTVFGSLLGIAHHWQEGAASVVTCGLAISVFPIVLRALPAPRRPETGAGVSRSASRLVGVLVYIALVTGLVLVLNE